MNLNQQIEDWFVSRKKSFQPSNRPFVTLSYAQSWDGSITTRQGETLPLSGMKSTRLTHQLRSLHDGILVGIGTVLTDDPQLTVREWQGPNPQPIVLDSMLRMPHTARLCHHPDKQCWILTMRPCNGEFGKQAAVITLEYGDGEHEHVPLRQALQLLREKGINTLMVEGGATIITAFLKARLADAVVITVAPRLIGGYKAVGNLGLTEYQLPQIHPIHWEGLGEDLIVWGDLHYGAAAA
jgi:riboflavin-specific deaminase-like protein